MEKLFRDLRYGAKGLLKRPVFAIVTILTLTLGIGANTAIFTLVNAVLLQTLPVSHPEELVLFSGATGEGTSVEDSPPLGKWQRFSYESYQYFRNHNQSFQDITAFRSGETRLSVRRTDLNASDVAQRASGHLVGGNYFSLLGVSAMLGRVLTPDDDASTATPTTVVSYRYWQQQLNSDPSIVGKKIILNNTDFTIIGVTPPEFFGERVRQPADFWMPLSFQPQIELRKSYLQDNEAYWLSIMGRLNRNVSLEQAQAATNLALRQFITESAGSKLNEERQRGIEKAYVELVSGAGGISNLRSLYSKPLHMLMAIVAMVLLIACANVGSLLLSRAAGRKAEMSLRMALGASRLRVIRQLLTESLLLAVIGGICGIIVSHWAVLLLIKLVAKDAPLDTRPNVSVLLFTALVSIIAGGLFGALPAIRASRNDLALAMKERSRIGSGRSRFNVSSALVVLQVALSMVLLTGAGLFARSLTNLQNEQIGFKHQNVLVLGIDPRLGGYKPSELSSLYQHVIERLKGIPNVQSVSLSTFAPMSGTNRTSSVVVRGYTPQTNENVDVQDNLIGPEYSETLGIPLLKGRTIDLRDNAASEKVGLVNQSFVDRYFKDQNPLGRIVSFDGDDQKDSGFQIVGVLSDIKSSNARETTQPAVYRPILQIQDESAYSVAIEVRTSGDPSGFATPIREAINQVDAKLPIFGVTTLTDQFNATFKQDRLITQLVSFFGLVALLLACIGLYGVMAHGVVRRTNEIGIRMALGADRSRILVLILRETSVVVLIGLLIGVPLAIASARLISSQLFGLTATDPLTLLVAALILTSVALVAGYLPARRASKVDPLIALRYE